jgi:2-polyprenyl-3-methyl-5-hydroxy-6-metoxy-1,4-benzoquinol methylase
VVSVDIDPEPIQKAKQLFGIDVVQGDVNELPFEDNAFDIVVAGELLEHTVNPFHALSKLFRLAKERVVISVPVGEYWLGEKSHIWELGGCFIQHDTVQKYEAVKDILIFEWTRRRTNDLKDIPPFSFEKWNKKYRTA